MGQQMVPSKEKDQMKDHNRAPIVEAIEHFVKESYTPFAVPGHKSGRKLDGFIASTLGYSPFQHDVFELCGFDDRKASNGIKVQAEEFAADAYHSDAAFFSTNGSSLSAHACVMSICSPGDKVVVNRNSHKSVIVGLMLANAEPHFVEAEYDARWDIFHGVA